MKFPPGLHVGPDVSDEWNLAHLLLKDLFQTPGLGLTSFQKVVGYTLLYFSCVLGRPEHWLSHIFDAFVPIFVLQGKVLLLIPILQKLGDKEVVGDGAGAGVCTQSLTVPRPL